MECHGETINVKLMAKREGDYTVYIFKNLVTQEYITVTKLPNWEEETIDVGQEGFLTYKFVKAFQDTWTNKQTGEVVMYQYSANYYLSFLPCSHVIKDNSVCTELLVK